MNICKQISSPLPWFKGEVMVALEKERCDQTGERFEKNLQNLVAGETGEKILRMILHFWVDSGAICQNRHCKKARFDPGHRKFGFK